jgi:hypothetical protein
MNMKFGTMTMPSGLVWHFIGWVRRADQIHAEGKPQPKRSADEIAEQNAADLMGTRLRFGI